MKLNSASVKSQEAQGHKTGLEIYFSQSNKGSLKVGLQKMLLNYFRRSNNLFELLSILKLHTFHAMLIAF